MNDTKPVTPEQRTKEFPDQKLVVSSGNLFCREELALKKSILELHFKSEKHTRGKMKLVNKDMREQDIVKALAAYDKEVHPVGESLPTDQRVKVVSTFLKAGVLRSIFLEISERR